MFGISSEEVEERSSMSERALGFEPERLEFHNNSAAMGPQLAEIFRNMTETVRNLGPSPVKKRVA